MQARITTFFAPRAESSPPSNEHQVSKKPRADVTTGTVATKRNELTAIVDCADESLPHLATRNKKLAERDDAVAVSQPISSKPPNVAEPRAGNENSPPQDAAANAAVPATASAPGSYAAQQPHPPKTRATRGLAREGAAAKQPAPGDGADASTSGRGPLDATLPPRWTVRSAGSTSSPADGVSEYERRRLERIRLNEERLRAMGLDQLARQSRPAALRPPAARPRRLPQASPPPRRALRRSARNNGAAAEKIAGAEEEAASSSSDESEPEYASSGVLRYVIEHSEAGSPKVAGPPAKNARASAGELRRSLECAAPQLARSYGVDVARGLLAAGGKDGVVAVWGLDSRGCVAEGGCARVAEPLLCAALHRSWVCDVQLVSWLAPDQGGEGAPDPALAPPALLTGGNDGYLRLWDLGASAGGRPRPLVEEGALHRSGVFSAHAHAAVPRVLSGSKDGTVCLSEGWERGGAKEVRRWEAGGVVKTLRWREMGGRGGDTAEADAFTFAFGGNDRVLRVCDTRADAGLELDLAHATALGCLRWSPRDPNLILSASHDPAILVHDLRAPKEPLLSLGVLHAKGKRLASITQPAWVAGGRCIAVPTASGSALALHCGASGALLSCGELGFAVGATHGDRSSEGLWVSGPRAVHHLQPA